MSHLPPLPVRIALALTLLAAAVGYWFFFLRPAQADSALSASGTVEAVSVRITPERGGRVLDVLVDAGDIVTAGQPLVILDSELLAGQRVQTEAQLAAAQAQFDLLLAGASDEQIAVAETVVERAEASLDALNEQLDTAEALGPQGAGQVVLLTPQLAVAEATLDNANAQLDLLQAGPRDEQIAAAQAQIDALNAALALLDLQIARQTLTAPIDGVVLTRTIQPGELAAPGATLLVISQLNDLTITVFVPEDRYGQISLGQTAVLTVDSFPDDQFTAVVQHIADQAEFTPRNVQTAEGRASTVYAVELRIQTGLGQLKPGMPADVDFGGAGE